MTKEQGQQLQKDFELDFFMETSAKLGLNTTELFVKVAKVLYEDYSKYKKKPKKLGENLKKDDNNNNNTNKIKKCC